MESSTNETVLGMLPFLVGQTVQLRLKKRRMRVFRAGDDKAGASDDGMLEGLDNPVAQARFGDAFSQARDEIELVEGASPPFDADAFRRGEQTPVFFGSAINNFGVREVLDALVDLRAAAGPWRRCGGRRCRARVISGVVFTEIQATWRRIATGSPSCGSRRAASSVACA